MKNLATIVLISLFTIGLFSMVTYTSCKKTEATPACKNGGVYTDGVCKCPEGFQGIYCETAVDYCQQTGCQNGGVCVGYCRCPAGFYGKYCEIDSCKGRLCNNGGVCKEGRCVCAPGYSGPACDTLMREKYLGNWRYIGYHGGKPDTIQLVIDDVNRNNLAEVNVNGRIYYEELFGGIAMIYLNGQLQSHPVKPVSLKNWLGMSFVIARKGQQLEFYFNLSGDSGSHLRDTVLMDRY